MFGNQNLISTGEKMEVEKVWEKKKKKDSLSDVDKPDSLLLP